MSRNPQKPSALVSLTATYTDSEGSAESDEDEQIDDRSSSRDSTPQIFGLSALEKRTSKLVSYSTHEGFEDEGGREEIDDDMELDYDPENSESSNERKTLSAESRRPISPVTFHRSLMCMRPEDIELPLEYPGRCSNALQDKTAKYYEKKIKEGKNMNESIQKMKDFRNPSIYEKLISYCGIDEMGTNYPPEVYDPHSWGPESLYDELAKRQKEEMDKKEKERKEKTKVEFISGTAKKPNHETQTALDLALKRRSKWDVGAVLQAPLKPATLITPSVLPIATATGTKPTVISAFGTISKKKP